jgi:hypothetical protein
MNVINANISPLSRLGYGGRKERENAEGNSLALLIFVNAKGPKHDGLDEMRSGGVQLDSQTRHHSLCFVTLSRHNTFSDGSACKAKPGMTINFHWRGHEAAHEI